MSRVAAFFDIDHTVLEANSGIKWVGYQWRTGKLSIWQVLLAFRWLAEYRFGNLDFEAMARRIMQTYQGRTASAIYGEVEAFFERDVMSTICVQARERLAYHRDAGHVLALLTSATHFMSKPLADALDVEHILCTEVEVAEGRLTGRTLDPLCYGAGKVTRAEAFARHHGVDLDRSYFYSDSVSDLPMLERVGEPRVVNPDPRLRRIAIERGWAYEIWRAPPKLRGRARTDVESRSG